VLAYFTKFETKRGRPPTLQEICVKFGWSDTNGACQFLRELTRAGKLERDAEVLGHRFHLPRGRDLGRDERIRRLRVEAKALGFALTGTCSQCKHGCDFETTVLCEKASKRNGAGVEVTYWMPPDWGCPQFEKETNE